MRSRKWARRILRLPDTITRTFELDDRGKTLWDACDGDTSVADIIETLAREYNLDKQPTTTATLAFLNTLIRRGLLVIERAEKQRADKQSDDKQRDER